MPRSRRSSILVPLALAMASVVAQSPDPQQADPQQLPAVLRVELVDGTPMPGVPIRRPLGEPAAGIDLRDGWLRNVPQSIIEAAWPEVGRTDPEGKLVLMVQEGALHEGAVLVGPPFRARGFVRRGEHYQLRVERLEQFVVRASDAAGRPLGRFPMVLRQDDRDVGHAVTDARGVATFGIDPRDRARLVVVPFGWIGPTDGFPTVAAQLPDKQVPFAVPEFVRVRVRTTVGGVVKAAGLRGVDLRSRGGTFYAREQGVPTLLGVEIGPVAIGETVQGRVLLPNVEAPFAVKAVATPDGVVVVDVDADPRRPQFALQLVAPGLRAAKPESRIGEGPMIDVSVRLRVVTDAGSFPCPMESIAGDRMFADPAMGSVFGSQIRRFDVDVTETAMSVGSGFVRETRAWSGTRAVALELAPGVLDLGTFELKQHEGVLRGRVVDEAGKPVARANVDVTVDGGDASQLLCTEADGTFVLTGPLLRANDGAPGRVVATASLGEGPDCVRSEPSPAQAQGGEVTLVLARAARGFLLLTVRNPRVVPPYALQFEWVAASGKVLSLGPERAHWQGTTPDACRLGPLPAGRGALRVLLRPGVLLRTVADLEVVAGKVVPDPRLAALDLAGVVATCRMRVVDEEGVPIAGARVEYRGVSDQWSAGPSDGGGVLEIVKGPPKALRIQVSATGMQPIEVAEVVDGGELRLRPLPNLCVTVKGLPADIARADLALFCRSVVRANLADHAQAPFGAGDITNVPLPPPGRYHLQLTLKRPAGRGTSWTFVGQRTDDVLVGKDGEAIEFVVDEAMVARLRELLNK